MSKKNMAQATVIVAVLSVLSKVMGFVREQLIAWLFGASGLTDAYVVALAIPTVLTGLISTPVSTAFLPVFASYVALNDKKGAKAVASSVITLSISLFLVVALVSIPFAPKLVELYAPGFTGHIFDNAVSLTRLFFPAFVLPLLGAFLKSILNTYKQFAAPGIAPFVQNLCIVALVITLGSSLDLRALAIATVVGYLANVLIQAPWVKKIELGIKLSPEINHGTKKVLKLAIPLSVGGFATQLYNFVDKNLASRLASGSISALNFANRIRSLPMDLFVSAVVTVIYPSLSEMWARKDKSGVGETLITGARFALFVCVPSAVGLLILANPMVRIVFQRGAFTEAATLLTSSALSVYAVGIVAMALIKIVDVGFFSSQNTWYPVILSLGIACVNIVFDFVFVSPLGHTGLALANVIASWVGATVGLKLFTKYVAEIKFKQLAQSGIKILISSLIMGVFTWAFGSWSGLLFGTGSTKTDVFLMIAAVSGSTIIYLVGAFVLKCEEIILLTNLVKRKIGL